MDANIEKYRGLSGIVKTYTKRELFGPTGLFGDPEKNPRPFELFRKWILKVTRVDKNQIAHNSINAQKFAKFLRDTQEKDENDDLIKKIEQLHASNIIEDRTPEKNTLLTFAKELDSLNLINDENNYLNNYRIALRSARFIEPVKEEIAKISKVADEPKKSEAGELKKEPSLSPESVTAGSGQSIRAAGFSENKPEEETLNAKIETANTETITDENIADKNIIDKKVPTNGEEIDTKPANKEMGEIKIPELAKIPTETLFKPKSEKSTSTDFIKEEETEFRESLSKSVFATNEERPSAVVLKRPIHKKVLRVKGTEMRSSVKDKGVRRVQELQTSHDDQRAQSRSNQNNQESEQFYDYQNEVARRAQLARMQQGGKKKKGFVGKLIKRGAVATALGGGAFLGLLVNSDDTTANAASFIATHSISTFDSIISLIHLFIK